MNDADVIQRIREYWRERGYEVDADQRTCITQTPGGTTWRYQAVRSDMRGGLPRGYKGDQSELNPDAYIRTRRRQMATNDKPKPAEPPDEHERPEEERPGPGPVAPAQPEAPAGDDDAA